MPIRRRGQGRAVNRKKWAEWTARVKPIHPLSQYASWRIRQKRLALKITQKDFCAAMGLHMSAYRRLEYGVASVSLAKLWRASRIFNCHVLELLDGFVPPEELHQKQHAKQIAVNDAVAMGADPMAPQSASSSSQSEGSGSSGSGGAEGGSKDGPSISTERS